MKIYGKAVLGCVLAACLSSAAVANPVNYEKDLAGKKICWNAPTAPPAAASTETSFYPGGKAVNSYSGALKITRKGNGWSHVDTEKGTSFESHIEKLPDGTFKFTDIIGGGTYEGTGRYCQ